MRIFVRIQDGTMMVRICFVVYISFCTVSVENKTLYVPCRLLRELGININLAFSFVSLHIYIAPELRPVFRFPSCDPVLSVKDSLPYVWFHYAPRPLWATWSKYPFYVLYFRFGLYIVQAFAHFSWVYYTMEVIKNCVGKGRNVAKDWRRYGLPGQPWGSKQQSLFKVIASQALQKRLLSSSLQFFPSERACTIFFQKHPTGSLITCQNWYWKNAVTCHDFQGV